MSFKRTVQPVLHVLIGFVIGVLCTTICFRPGKPSRLTAEDVSQIWAHEELASLSDHSKVRVLCWVMTSPDNLLVKAVHVRATWGKRCNKLLFASDHYEPQFPTINISVQSGIEHLVDKTLATFKYIYKHHLNDADWFIKADDDTYVIMDNLRHLLSDKNPEELEMFGNHFMTGGKDGFMSGGAGYVISKGALAKFGQQQESRMCRNVDSFAEDIFWTECMVSLGVHLGDSRDHLGRSRFHCQDVNTIVHGTGPEWTLKYGGSKANISDSAISFHYIKPQMMYTMELMVYHLNPLGLKKDLN